MPTACAGVLVMVKRHVSACPRQFWAKCTHLGGHTGAIGLSPPQKDLMREEPPGVIAV